MKRLSDFLKQTKKKVPHQGGAFEPDSTNQTSSLDGRFSNASSHWDPLLQRTMVWFQVNIQPIANKLDWNVVCTSSYILAASFVLANAVSTSAAQASFKLFHSVKRAKGPTPEDLPQAILMSGAMPSTQRTSISVVKEEIFKRNLFNSTGAIAPDGDSSKDKSSNVDFDKVPCTKESLPVEVLGTIFTGNSAESVVIIKDPKVADADIYQVGKAIIDHEDYEIYKIGQGTLEIRKIDQKICLDLTGREPELASADGAGSAPKPEASETIDVSDEEMKNLLGPELARAMNEVKLIPLPVPGGTGIQGFQVLALVPGSVYDRAKLQNEDIILEVNGQSLKDPGQGYRLLEAFQQQREITINFTRKGEPMVRKVRVK
jgi:type II secretory pathway component PulC